MVPSSTYFINLPEDIHRYIANFLRPRRWTQGNTGVYPPADKIDPFRPSPDIANIQISHPNLMTIPLWKQFEWKEHIRKWRCEILTKMIYEYPYRTLSDKMIEMGWAKRINKLWRHQNCYVKYNIIWCKVSLADLIPGSHPLPSVLGRSEDSEKRLATVGSLQLTVGPHNCEMVPAPTLKMMIPKYKRRKWLIECFMACVLQHWGYKIVDWHRENVLGTGVQKNFMKTFNKIMGIPSNYNLSQTELFKMFLTELKVRAKIGNPDT